MSMMVVCADWRTRDVLRRRGVEAFAIGDSLMGYRWDLIICPHDLPQLRSGARAEREMAERWMKENLPLKVAKDGALIFI